MSSIVYGGLDVHKDTIVACLIVHNTGEVLGEEFPNDHTRLERVVRRWGKLGELRLCYEASGAGFVIKRWLDNLGIHCDVIAPSLIPRAPGERVKTDKRDARKLATLYAGGVLQAVRVPDQEEETVRALVRLHDEMTRDMTRTKNRVLKYLATLGFYYRDGNNWTTRHRTWLNGLTLTPIQRLILQTHLDELDHLRGQLEGIDRKIEELAHTERYWAQVQRLLSLKGIGLYSAMV
ncbi:MAG: IS110 family transposase, partial [Dehalococcoidia bacterium]|nr:IS110 family transposase [Dehalococcoidia bacterium]